MFFATATHPQIRREAYANAGQSLERFMGEALRGSHHQGASETGKFTQDETSFGLTFDVPGVSRDQLAIAIGGAVVRITTKEGAPRSYRAAYELPQDIDPANSEAKLENGVLTLKLAKLVPVDRATELAIQ
ncbi:MAG: Hsp20 family protein [Candidatus Saccharibacteria bacterium]|nr:Hsp20 family protein [Rhodoferax sp.]